MGHRLHQVKADALIRHTLAVGADAGVELGRRLESMAALAREAFHAERAWIVDTDPQGAKHHLAEVRDPEFPGATDTNEVVPVAALTPQVMALQQKAEPILFVDPFPELDTEGREFLRRYQVKATAQALSRGVTHQSRWLVGLDFCRKVPRWREADNELLREFSDAIAMSVESARLFQAVEQAKRELEIVFETQRDGVAMLDRSGKVLRRNQAYAALLSCVPSEAGHGQEMCCMGMRLGEQGCSLEHARTSGEGRVIAFSEEGGRGRWMQCTVQQVAGDPNRFIHVLRDISEQRLLSERSAQKARLESLGTLAGGVAHEFNNILMGMEPAVERLNRATSTDPGAVQLIASAVERASDLTRRMLALSRQQAGLVGRCELTKALHEIVAVLRSSLPKNVHVALVIDGDPGWVGLEAGALDSVFLNLATNARDAMPGGGEVAFTARREEREEGSVAVVEVADTGVGIAASDLARIFDPFFTTKPPGEGTGLGLSLVHRLVSEAHGTVSAGSAGAGLGATFTITLPILAPSARIMLAPEPAKDARLDGARVLVVDDEQAIREGVAMLLREAGAEVVACESAEDALYRFGDVERPFHVAVVDFGLPGMDGCTLLGQLLEARPELTGVLASGYADTQRFTPLQERGVLFFQKPFHVGNLIRALAARLGKS
ncbi:MAG: ATP-binding protein [Thermoanaerobaculales bacterium]